MLIKYAKPFGRRGTVAIGKFLCAFIGRNNMHYLPPFMGPECHWSILGTIDDFGVPSVGVAGAFCPSFKRLPKGCMCVVRAVRNGFNTLMPPTSRRIIVVARLKSIGVFKLSRRSTQSLKKILNGRIVRRIADEYDYIFS